jgi:hypothetical protein
MPIIGTVGSSYYVPPVYALAQTFDSSGTFTIPAGKTQMAIMTFLFSLKYIARLHIGI